METIVNSGQVVVAFFAGMVVALGLSWTNVIKVPRKVQEWLNRNKS